MSQNRDPVRQRQRESPVLEDHCPPTQQQEQRHHHHNDEGPNVYSATITAATQSLDEAIAQEINTIFEVRPSLPKRVFKVLVVGNSGRGKSLLCNLIVGKDVFLHQMQLNSVTSATEFHCLEVLDVGIAVIYNLPGLIEADEKNLIRNQSAIEVGVRSLAGRGVPTTVLYVCRDTNGRLSDEDTVAIRTFADFVHELPTSAAALINNGVDDDEFESEEKRLRWEAEAKTMLVHTLDHRLLPQNVYFVPKLTKAERRSIDEGRCAQEGHNLLRNIVVGNLLKTAIAISPDSSSHLVLDFVAIKEQTAALKAKEATEKQRMAAELQRNEQERADAMMAMRMRQEEQLAAMRVEGGLPADDWQDAKTSAPAPHRASSVQGAQHSQGWQQKQQQQGPYDDVSRRQQQAHHNPQQREHQQCGPQQYNQYNQSSSTQQHKNLQHQNGHLVQQQHVQEQHGSASSAVPARQQPPQPQQPLSGPEQFMQAQRRQEAEWAQMQRELVAASKMPQMVYYVDDQDKKAKKKKRSLW